MRATLLALTTAVVAGCGPGFGLLNTSPYAAMEPMSDAAESDPDVVEGDDIRRRDIRRVEEMLRGQVAGVRVEQNGDRWSIRIRGAETFGQSNADPLFVIDGVPIPLGVEGALDGINPRDVESIRVLKNASDTAMYGSRGANGVILITTIRPPEPSDDADG